MEELVVYIHLMCKKFPVLYPLHPLFKSGRYAPENGQRKESENQDTSCVLIQAGTYNQYLAAKKAWE